MSELAAEESVLNTIFDPPVEADDVSADPFPYPILDWISLNLLNKGIVELVDGLFRPGERMTVIEALKRLDALRAVDPTAFKHLEDINPMLLSNPIALPNALYHEIRRRQLEAKYGE